jgi:hypothetical protein
MSFVLRSALLCRSRRLVEYPRRRQSWALRRTPRPCSCAVAHHLEWIRISLDAPDEATYCELHGVRAEQGHYAKVLSNVSALAERVDTARIRLAYLVVPPINHERDKILAVADLASTYDVQHIVFRPAFVSHTARQEDWWESSNAIREAKQHHGSHFVLGGSGGSWGDQVLGLREQPSGPCRTRPLVMVIKADGTIPSCILFRERLGERPPLGNIADGFEAV